MIAVALIAAVVMARHGGLMTGAIGAPEERLCGWILVVGSIAIAAIAGRG